MEEKLSKAAESQSVLARLAAIATPGRVFWGFFSNTAPSLMRRGLTHAGVAQPYTELVPLVGSIGTIGASVREVYANILKKEWGRAATATMAGSVEVAGGIVGPGLGEAAREVVRTGIIYTAGEKYAPNTSDLRQMAESAYDVIDDTPQWKKIRALWPFFKAAVNDNPVYAGQHVPVVTPPKPIPPMTGSGPTC